MTPQELAGWISFARLAIDLGIHTGRALSAILHAHGLTNEEQDAILQAVHDDALTRAIRSRREAGQV